MKRLVVIGISLLALLSCTRQEMGQEQDVNTISFSADSFCQGVIDEAETKVTLDASNHILWTLTDTLGVFPNTGAQVYFITTTPGASTTSFDGGGWGFKSGATYYSYSPFVGNIYLNRSHIPVSFSGQVQDGVSDTNIGECCFMYTDAISAEAGSLNFQYHHLGCIIRVRATLPAGTYTRLAITAPTDAFIVDGWYDLMAATPSITPTRMGNQLSIALNNITLASETQITVYLMTAPVNLQGTEITVSVLNSERVEYQQHKTPSGQYVVGTLNGLTCNAMEAVPQNMGLILEGWGDGGSIGGNAD